MCIRDSVIDVDGVLGVHPYFSGDEKVGRGDEKAQQLFQEWPCLLYTSVLRVKFVDGAARERPLPGGKQEVVFFPDALPFRRKMQHQLQQKIILNLTS